MRSLILTNRFAADGFNLVTNNLFVNQNVTISGTYNETLIDDILTLNTSGSTLSIFYSIVSMDISSNSINSTFDLGVMVNLVNSSRVVATIYPISNTTTIISKLNILYIIYNQYYFNQSNFAAFEVG